MINPFQQAGVPALVGAALAAFAVGAISGYWLTRQYDNAQFALWQAQQARQQAAAIEQVRQREQAFVRRGEQLSVALLEEQQAHAATAQQLNKEIDRVTSQYRAKSGAPLQPVPHCVYTNGFVGLYNRAIGADAVSPDQSASGADAATGTSETIDSGVSQQDLLAHAIDNGERCRNITSQLNRLIDYTEGLK